MERGDERRREDWREEQKREMEKIRGMRGGEEEKMRRDERKVEERREEVR